MTRTKRRKKNKSICRKIVPPAICLCQPTDLTSHNRQRWEVKLDFVDEHKLVLGDSGWWPGALGNYFDFETQLENVDRYITASEVPQTRMLYVEYLKVPRPAKKDRKVKDKKPAHLQDLLDSEESSSSNSQSGSEAGGDKERAGRGSATPDAARRGAGSRGQQKKTKHPEKSAGQGATKETNTAGGKEGETCSLMLPPLLQTR